MSSDPATWLTVIAWISLGVAFGCAAVIAWDVFVAGHRQQMAIMDVVYPVSALYLGPLGLWFYFRYGRATSRSGAAWPAVAKGVSHCGAGCTLGDICGEWLVFVTGFAIGLTSTVAFHQLLAMYALDFAFAWTFGIVFQYLSIVPMRELSPGEGLREAIKADTLSIVAFQVGLFGCMALVHLVLWDPPLRVDSAAYWMTMQIGMVAGFLTAYPVNSWLVRRGTKEAM